MVTNGKQMSLGGATMLVTANMVGTGIFLLPVSMASIGSISTLGWIVAAIGAGAIGMMFAQLGATNPQPGGPYAYARDALGPYLGFQTNYVYWSANLVGNIAVATTVTGYFTQFIPALHDQTLASFFSVGIIWLATFINILGPGFVGAIAGSSAALALIPLFIIGGFGWFWFDPQTFIDGWNPHDKPVFTAISQSAAYALWAFMGIESASVAAGVIKNPRRNIPLATLFGLIIATLLYVSTCTVLLGIIPATELAKSSDPFSQAAQAAIGTWAAIGIGICAIMKTGASLVGWTLTISQSATAAANDRMFPRIYAKTNRRGIPIYNLLLSACLMSVIVFATASPTLAQQFDEIIDMAVILTILPYLHSAVALFLQGRQENPSNRTRILWAVVGAVVCLYCLWAVAGSDAILTRNAMIVLFLSVPLYLFFLPKAPSSNSSVKND